MNNLLLEVEGPIAVLTINRPKALNALNSETLTELNEVLTEIEGRDDIKVVILTGAGEKSFVAGADISEMVNFSAAEGRAFGMRASEDVYKRQIKYIYYPDACTLNKSHLVIHFSYHLSYRLVMLFETMPDIILLKNNWKFSEKSVYWKKDIYKND